MVKSVVSVTDIAGEITKQLAIYTEDVKEKVVEASDTVTKEAVSTLKQVSRRLTGSYAKGWTRKKVGKHYVVHNATDYQLTHLLEKGHANRGGGRTQSFVHIRPVEEESVRKFENLVEEAVKG